VGGEELSDAEREELLQLCRQRLDAFREQRGEEVGCLLMQKPAPSGTAAATAPRSADRSTTGCSPVPKAAANAAGQAVAWQPPHQRALEVDPIVPRNHGGSDDLNNLQALCFRCNAGKRDGCLPTQEDSTDFRGLQASYAHRQDGCVFCALEASGRMLLENELALCIADADPVTPGHSLVIPRRHGADGLALHQPEWNAVVALLKRRREQQSAHDPSISGWNVGLNSGEAAGQTVFHAHWHLIPRREGDCEEPRGEQRPAEWCKS
jgi:diadenosine tetraphosphate (Ap4A) HIT family hydrolase